MANLPWYMLKQSSHRACIAFDDYQGNNSPSFDIQVTELIVAQSTSSVPVEEPTVQASSEIIAVAVPPVIPEVQSSSQEKEERVAPPVEEKRVTPPVGEKRVTPPVEELVATTNVAEEANTIETVKAKNCYEDGSSHPNFAMFYLHRAEIVTEGPSHMAGFLKDPVDLVLKKFKEVALERTVNFHTASDIYDTWHLQTAAEPEPFEMPYSNPNSYTWDVEEVKVSLQGDGAYNNAIYSGIGKLHVSLPHKWCNLLQKLKQNKSIIGVVCKISWSVHPINSGEDCTFACSSNLTFMKSLKDEYTWAKHALLDLAIDRTDAKHLTRDPESSAYKAADDLYLENTTSTELEHFYAFFK
ncbi:Hypothetical predicted protein [Mytilus galloprovincialis]|uniref:Uncharacterized protein n=1 Tax=Mytilus galloprovincialis TaxID=29158 RepID=A0A8B6G9H7_MYTGA|nr:Hypothetical predicted protein [Mytilus galloprovincialis]